MTRHSTPPVCAPVAVPGLDVLAAEPDRARDLPADCVALLQTRCLLVLNALLSRQLALQTTEPTRPPVEESDVLLTVSQAADRLQQTSDWLYRHAHDLPFTVRVGRQLRFSSQGIARFIRERAGLQ